MNDRVEAFPLSLTQQDIYFDQLHFGRSPLYNVGGYIRMGRCDVDRLSAAHARLVSGNDVFGIRIRSTDSGVCQQITTNRTTTLPLVDLSGELDPAATAKSRLESLFQAPFKLEDGELYRAFVMKLADDRFWYVCLAHHLIMDGWGFSNLARVLGGHYHGQTPEPPMPWREVVSSDQAYLKSEKYRKDREHWLAHCGEAPEKLLTPFYKERFKGSACIPSGREVIEIEPAEYREVRALADRLGVGVSQVLLGVFVAYFARAYARRRLIVGIPAHNRRGHREKQMLGAFTSVSPLCVATNESLSFAELTRSLREAQRKNFRHQRYPIGDFLRDLGLTGRNNSLYDIGFNYLRLNSFLTVGREQAQLFYLTHFHEATPLMLTVWEYGDDFPIELQFDYNHAYFEAAEAKRIANRFLHLLRTVLAGGGAGAQLSTLPLPTEDERRALQSSPAPAQSRKGSNQDDRRGVHHLFESRVEKTPDRPAVVGDDRTLSYAEFNSRANRLARHLLAQGVKESSLVAVCLRRSPDLLVAIMAVLKAGCAYVPLDPDYPRSRLDFMLSDSRACLMLTESGAEAIAPRDGVPRLRLDSPSLADKLREYSSLDLGGSPGFSANHLAYVMYTSGSTGRPKGVMVSHGNLKSYCRAVNSHYRIDGDDTLLQFSSHSFDIFVEEVFACLLFGGRLVLRNDDVVAGGDAFWRFVQDNNVTVLSPPTAFWHSLCAGLKVGVPPVDCLRLVSVGGEAMSGAMLRRWRGSFGPGVTLLNIYGPTEGTVSATVFDTEGADGRRSGVPIGHPLANTRCYVLDQRQRLSPPGVPGELYLAGDGIARGYLNRPGLTARNFLPDPFDASGGRLYKTGDLVRWLPNGALDFLGRADEQLKIRGFRIEPSEIEAALLDCGSVREAFVHAHGNPPVLVAYVVPAGDAGVVSGLKSHLRRTLPEHMVPSAIVCMETLPLTTNGKLDCNRLPRPKREDHIANAFVAPRHELEAELSRIWARVLRLERVGVDDHFFEIGGSSLIAVELQRTINARLGASLKITDLFANPTVEDLAAHISGQGDGPLDQPEDRRVERRVGAGRDIAVIAMACRFPDADTPEAFWRNLCEGKESIQFFSDQQLRDAGVSEELLERPNYVKSGFVLEGLDEFDAPFFGFTPREADLLDPQQRLLFECAQEALERGGYGRREKRNKIGVFVGVGQTRYLFEQILPNRELIDAFGETAVMMANLGDFAATRLSHKLDLRGPSVNLNAACASSLVAVHFACASLFDGSSDMALAGASSIAMYRPTGVLANEWGIASSDGRCRAFDADADGTRPGSGAGVVLLKRLDDAIADGDPILAVIKGSAINNDGANKVGYTAPSVDGQAFVVGEALRAAGVSSAEVSFVEAHGTGTKLGDPIEVAALRKVFPPGQRPYCAIGSVKPNIGHLDCASGMASLIKVGMALEHRKLPPQIHFTRANPEIELDRGPFYINREAVDWKNGSGPRTAGVNSFGIGGTNAHVVLRQAPARPSEGSHREEQLILFSAKTESALSVFRLRMREFVARQPNPSLADMAYTLQVGRASHAFRAAIVARSVEELSHALAASTDFTETTGGAPEIVFMFPGEGSQYVGMGREIYRREPVFRSAFDRCAELLEPELELDIRRFVLSADESSPTLRRVEETRVAQPLLFAFEYSLAELLRAWGVHPSLMIGHGLGEYVAACLANVFDLPGALKIVAARGRLTQKTERGAMLEAPIPEAGLSQLLARTGCELAAVNADESCVAAGSPERVARLEALLNEQRIAATRLNARRAFHTVLMEPILNDFRSVVESVPLKSPTIPYVSNLTGQAIGRDEARDPDYWPRHLRSTVRFGAGAKTPKGNGNRIFLEVGPGTALSSLVKRGDGLVRTVTTVGERGEKDSDERGLLLGLGKLWQSGVEFDHAAFFARDRRRKVVLPTHPFERRRHWVDRPDAALGEAAPTLAARPKLAAEYVEPRFRIEMELAEIWRRFLGVEKIGVNDDFFALGGDSLMLTRVIAEINRRWRVSVSAKTAFERSTILAMAVSLAGLIAAGEEGESDEARFVEELV